MTESDPILVADFERAAALGHTGQYRAAASSYADVVRRACAHGSEASRQLVAVAHLRRALCLMAMRRFAEAHIELEWARAFERHLDGEGRYELHLALGHTLCALGEVQAAVATIAHAISVAKELDGRRTPLPTCNRAERQLQVGMHVLVPPDRV